jgi:integrase
MRPIPGHEDRRANSPHRQGCHRGDRGPAKVEDSPYVFPADVGEGHFIGLVRILQRVCDRAEITGITPHVLRDTFATVAA